MRYVRTADETWMVCPTSRRGRAGQEEGCEEACDEEEDDADSEVKPREWVLVGLVVLVLFLLWRGNDAQSRALDRADAAESALPTLIASRDSAAHVADSLSTAAMLADSVVQAVVDSADARVARVVPRLIVQRDTLEVLVTDTTALRIIDERDAMFEGVIASKDSVIVEMTASRDLWRSSSLAKDEVIARSDSIIAVRADINSDLRAHIRGQSQKKWLERGAGLAAVVGVLLIR